MFWLGSKRSVTLWNIALLILKTNAVSNTAMYKWKYFIIFGFIIRFCIGAEPFKPRDGSLPFLVYFSSRYRGLCVGTLVSRTAVLTAAVCITNPTVRTPDTRPINVVTGATYRHPRRGIRVQVTKIIIPKLSNATGERAYAIQTSPAVLLLARKVPDVLAEIPQRAVAVRHAPDAEPLALHEECFMPGWHFFFKGDKIYPVHKFLLQRNVRVQFLSVVKQSLWCNTIMLKFQKAMTNLGYTGGFEKAVSICVRDPNREAQPCHGMYGAPLVCRGQAAGMLTAPDAQWANCTGHSNLVQLFSSNHLRAFMRCLTSLFEPDLNLSWEAMKKRLETDAESQQFDYLPDVYDKMMYAAGSSSDEV